MADETEIATELGRDRSASGTEHAARCRAARPDPEAKAAAWRTIMEDDDLSGRLVTAAAEGLWHPGQVDLMESYVERYFADMPRLAGRRTPGHGRPGRRGRVSPVLGHGRHGATGPGLFGRARSWTRPCAGW